MEHLPVEILADIFKHTVRESRATRIQPGQILQLAHLPLNEFNPPNYVDAPSAIAGTCRLWRNVALRERELWNVLEVINGVVYDVERYEVWLDRAGADAPIDACFHFSDPQKELCVQDERFYCNAFIITPLGRKLEQLLNLLWERRDNLRNLVLAMHYSLEVATDLKDPLEVLGNVTFLTPNVVSRRLCGRQWGDMDFQLYKLDAYGDYRAMKLLEIADHNVQWGSFIYLLQHAIQLETLFLDIDRFTPSGPAVSFFFPFLLYLSLRVRRTFDINIFSVPNLKQLKLEFLDEEDDEPTPDPPDYILQMMDDMLHKPDNLNLRRLQHLSLTGIHPDNLDSEPISEQICAIYTLMEELGTLDLCVDDKMLEPLFVDFLGESTIDETVMSSRFCLPKLKELRLWTSEDHFTKPMKVFQWGRIRNIVQTRKRKGAPLELLCVNDQFWPEDSGEQKELSEKVAKIVYIRKWDGLVPYDGANGGTHYSSESSIELESDVDL